MNATKITNVTHVANHFLMQDIWRNIFLQFMKATKITCESCGKSFTRADTLTRHIKTIHKDFKCDSCGKLFAEVGNLRKHISTIHKDHTDNKCESCGKNFTTVGYLRKHIKIVRCLKNVILVENYLLELIIWEVTSKVFTKVIKILNVNLVENYLLELIIWGNTSKLFMRVIWPWLIRLKT